MPGLHTRRPVRSRARTESGAFRRRVERHLSRRDRIAPGPTGDASDAKVVVRKTYLKACVAV